MCCAVEFTAHGQVALPTTMPLPCLHMGSFGDTGSHRWRCHPPARVPKRQRQGCCHIGARKYATRQMPDARIVAPRYTKNLVAKTISSLCFLLPFTLVATTPLTRDCQQNIFPRSKPIMKIVLAIPMTRFPSTRPILRTTK